MPGTKLKYYLLLKFYFCTITLFFAQQEYFNYRLFSEEDGLNTIYCYKFAEDKDGFIWMGSGDGLYRFDGHRFEKFKSPLDNDKHAISSLLIHLSYDKDLNRLWLMSTDDMQYIDLNHYTFHRWRDDKVPEMNQTHEFRQCYKINKQNIWISNGPHFFNYHIGKGQFSDLKSKFDDEDLLHTPYLRFFPYDEKHIILLNGSFIWIVETHTFSIKRKISKAYDEYFYSASFDEKRNTLYIGAKSKLICLHLKTNQKKEFSKFYYTPKRERFHYFINYFAAINDQTLLFPGESADMVFNKEKESLNLIEPIEAKMGQRIAPNSIFMDSKKNIWITSYQKYCGVLYQENLRLKSTGRIYNNKEVNIEPYRSIRWNDSTFLFCGSGISGVGVLKNSGESYLLDNANNPSPVVWDVLKLSNGTLWNSDPNQLNVIDINRKTFQKIGLHDHGKSLDKPNIRYIKQLNDSIVVGFANGYMYFIHNKTYQTTPLSILKYFPEEATKTDKIFYPLCTIGEKIFVTSDVGMFYIDSKFKITPFALPKAQNTGKSSGRINEMLVDIHGNWWFTSQNNGVFKFDPKQKVCLNFNEENTLMTNSHTFHITTDHKNRIWVTSGEKIYIFNATHNTIVSVYDRKSHIHGAGYSIYGSHTDSLMVFNYFPYILIMNNKQLDETKTNKDDLFLTAVYSEKLKHLSVPCNVDTNFIFDFTEKELCFKFCDLSSNNGNYVQYKYRIKGFSESWKSVDKNFICLQNIPHGDYTLEIQSLGNTRLEINKTIKVKLTIKPVFYKAGWFLTLVTLLGLGGLYFLYQWRVTQIRKEELLKSDFKKTVSDLEMKALRAQMNPHFVFNSLNSIQKFIFDKDEYAASQYLTKFSRLIRMILDSSEQDFITVEAEKDLLLLYLEMESLRFTQAFDFHIHIDPSISVDAKIPSMVIQPHVENAIWHGLLHLDQEKSSAFHRKGMLKIEFLRKSPDEIVVIVEDNGVGRTKAKEFRSKQVLKKKSYGSRISEERIRVFNEIHGMKTQYEVKDLVNDEGSPMGTRVTLSLAYATSKTL